jgi:hypothetical protein
VYSSTARAALNFLTDAVIRAVSKMPTHSHECSLVMKMLVGVTANISQAEILKKAPIILSAA